LSPDDASVVAAQIGRPPRGRWHVATRCPAGGPLVIAVAPVLEDGSPFPTTFWLTCPRLVEAVHDLESGGEAASFAQRAAAEPAYAERLRAADLAYRAARRVEGGGQDPCQAVGVAGQRDPLMVKCLHARLAAILAGIADPIGEDVADRLAGLLTSGCPDPRCRAHVGPGC
jgi:hypothetical protein